MLYDTRSEDTRNSNDNLNAKEIRQHNTPQTPPNAIVITIRLCTANHTNSPPPLISAPSNGRLIPNRLRWNAIHNQILPPMQPLIALLPFPPTPINILQQIRRPKHRAPSKMSRIHRHNPRILTIPLPKVLGHCFRMREVVVDADEGGGDVGLLVEVREAEAREGRDVV
jgi:hypothetical protein